MDYAQPTDGETEAQGGAHQLALRLWRAWLLPSLVYQVLREGKRGEGQPPREPRFLKPTPCRAGSAGTVLPSACAPPTALAGATLAQDEHWPTRPKGSSLGAQTAGRGAPSQGSAAQASHMPLHPGWRLSKVPPTPGGRHQRLRVTPLSPHGPAVGTSPTTKTLMGHSATSAASPPC